MSHNKFAKIPTWLFMAKVSGINQEFDAATQQAKRHVIPAPGKRSPINDFRAIQGFVHLVERLPQREALLDALAFSAISIGPVGRSAQRIWRLRMDLTRRGSTKKITGTIRFGGLVA
jgi:hypothetical protein